MLAEQGGELVCATAGHHMEAMLAGYGSGAARVSSDQGTRILNIDIGGGTTKLALIEKGRVTATAAIHIGGRLQVVDEEGSIVRLDPAGQHHAAQAGFRWRKGDRADEDDDRTVGFLDRDRVAQAIVVGHARRRHHVGGVVAGTKRHGKTDQRSRQAEGAPEIGGLP